MESSTLIAAQEFTPAQAVFVISQAFCQLQEFFANLQVKSTPRSESTNSQNTDQDKNVNKTYTGV